MKPSARALFARVIDYAGMFPPARLPLDEAIRNYATYCDSDESFMLSRFIAPVRLLDELGREHIGLFSGERPLALSVLAGADAATLEDGLAADLPQIRRFVDAQHGRAKVGVLELRLPALAEDVDAIVERAGELIEEQLGDGVSAYYELPAVGKSEQRDAVGGISEVVAALARFNSSRGTRASGVVGPAGLKLRCGGLEPDAYPSVDTVAHTLAACRDASVPFKATAGLHHPFRHRRESLEVTMHGFVNVFGAGVLAAARGLDEHQLQEVIAERDPAAFRFDERGFAHGDAHASLSEIEIARRDGVTSFGSCSFDEPRDDLRRLGLLDRCGPEDGR